MSHEEPHVLRSRCLAYLDLRRPHEALGAARSLANIEPTGPNLVLLSHCALLATDAPLALDAAKRAVAAAPELADAHLALAFAHVRKPRKISNRPAIRHARRAVALEPGEPTMHVDLARITLAAGSTIRGGRAMGRAVAMDPTSAPAWAELGNVQIQLGDLTRAQQSLEEALRLAPDQPKVQSLLAFVLARRGELERSLALQRAAIGSRPEASDLVLLAGRSANRKTPFWPLAITFGLLSAISLALVGVPSSVGWVPGAAAISWALNSIDEARVRRGRPPVLLPRRLSQQEGIGRAVVDYRKRLLRWSSVGPRVGWTLPSLVAAGALLGLIALGFASFRDPIAYGIALVPAALGAGLVAGGLRRRRALRSMPIPARGGPVSFRR